MSTTSPEGDAPSNGDTDRPQNAAPARTSVPSSKKFACVLCRRRKLKCDGAKPACGTCSRLKHDCSYNDDGPKRPVVKRRNIKDLEARLAQVEGKLLQEQAKRRAAAANSNTTAAASEGTANTLQWDDQTIDMDWNVAEDCFQGNDAFTESSFLADPVLNDDLFASSILPLGQEESLPPQEMMDELYRLYFTKLAPLMPMMHEGRFMASVNSAPHMRPLISLRYAIFAATSIVVESYNKYGDIFYKRARKYIEAEELKGLGESIVTIQHAQTWILLCNYEVRSTAFPRAWMSAGRSARISQMLGLDRMDRSLVMGFAKQPGHTSTDITDMEERRRTFWNSFCNDRWSAAGTGWAMMIDEEDILTNLPVSEEAFQNGTLEEPITLDVLYSCDGASRLTPYTGVIFMASLFGRNLRHMHRGRRDDNPADVKNGGFWKRHRSLDNVITTTLFLMPQHMKVPYGLRVANNVLVIMNLHASTICLHQAAIVKAEEYELDNEVIARSRARCSSAAEEIMNVMRMCSHRDITEMNPWVCFSLYASAQVFLENCRFGDDSFDQARYNLEFVTGALKSIQHRHPIVASFLAQLHQDMVVTGLIDTLPPSVAVTGTALDAYKRAKGIFFIAPEGDVNNADATKVGHNVNRLYRPAAFARRGQGMSADSSDGPSNSATPSDTNETSRSSVSGTAFQPQSFNLPTRSPPPSVCYDVNKHVWPYNQNSHPMYPKGKRGIPGGSMTFLNCIGVPNGNAVLHDTAVENRPDPNTSQQMNEMQEFDISNQEILNSEEFANFDFAQF